MLTALDRLQITETLARQAFVVDENKLDQLEEVFTPDTTYDMTSSGMGAFQGIEALRAAAEKLNASGHAPQSHFVTNVIITDDGADDGGDSVASVRSKALMIMSDGAVHSVVYNDVVALHEGRWLIASRVISPVRAADGE